MKKLQTPEAKKPNRMEKRRLETRGKLLNAAQQLVMEKGIDKTTMDDITDLADLGRRTFYYHFTSKEECMLAAMVGAYRKYARDVADEMAPTSDPAVVVAKSTQLVMARLITDPLTERLLDHPSLLGDAISQAIGPFVQRDVNIGIERGRFSPPLQGKPLDTLLNGIMGVIIIETNKHLETLEDLLQKYAQMFLMMLGIDQKEAEKIVKL